MTIEIGDAPLPDEEIARLHDAMVTAHARLEESSPLQTAFSSAVEQYERAAFNQVIAAADARRAARRARLFAWLRFR